LNKEFMPWLVCFGVRKLTKKKRMSTTNDKFVGRQMFALNHEIGYPSPPQYGFPKLEGLGLLARIVVTNHVKAIQNRVRPTHGWGRWITRRLCVNQ
jgi:hypothetical protein